LISSKLGTVPDFPSPLPTRSAAVAVVDPVAVRAVDRPTDRPASSPLVVIGKGAFLFPAVFSVKFPTIRVPNS
jgi:hypothetical protein